MGLPQGSSLSSSCHWPGYELSLGSRNYSLFLVCTVYKSERCVFLVVAAHFHSQLQLLPLVGVYCTVLCIFLLKLILALYFLQLWNTGHKSQIARQHPESHWKPTLALFLYSTHEDNEIIQNRPMKAPYKQSLILSPSKVDPAKKVTVKRGLRSRECSECCYCSFPLVPHFIFHPCHTIWDVNYLRTVCIICIFWERENIDSFYTLQQWWCLSLKADYKVLPDWEIENEWQFLISWIQLLLLLWFQRHYLWVPLAQAVAQASLNCAYFRNRFLEMALWCSR